MIKKDNGAILIVTVISMFILTIIGFVSLEMFISQNELVATDVAKVRTFYAADGVVEMMRGLIARDHSGDTGNDFDLAVITDPWTEANVINNAIVGGYDVTKPTAPNVYARVELRRVSVPPNSVDFSTTATVQYYRIMGVSSVTVNLDVIYSTVSYYFYYVSSITIGYSFAGWREHKIIQNDTGLIQ